MILVGIDIAKDKHECFIRTLEGTVLHKSFSIANNLEGFEELYSKICSCNDNEIKVGWALFLQHFGIFAQQRVGNFCT